MTTTKDWAGSYPKRGIAYDALYINNPGNEQVMQYQWDGDMDFYRNKIYKEAYQFDIYGVH